MAASFFTTSDTPMFILPPPGLSFPTPTRVPVPIPTDFPPMVYPYVGVNMSRNTNMNTNTNIPIQRTIYTPVLPYTHTHTHTHTPQHDTHTKKFKIILIGKQRNVMYQFRRSFIKIFGEYATTKYGIPIELCVSRNERVMNYDIKNYDVIITVSSSNNLESQRITSNNLNKILNTDYYNHILSLDDISSTDMILHSLGNILLRS